MNDKKTPEKVNEKTKCTAQSQKRSTTDRYQKRWMKYHDSKVSKMVYDAARYHTQKGGGDSNVRKGG